MRRARRVIVFLLIMSAAARLPAQQTPAPSEGSVDTDVTVMGRDESTIPMPEPEGVSEELVLPPIDFGEPDSLLVPPVLPPITDSLTPSQVMLPESMAQPMSAGK
jgi:hypothetical protein